MPNHLFLHAYAPQQVAGCRYFLLKYLSVYNLKPPAGTTVTVYTNDPVAFEGFTSFIPRFHMPDLLLNVRDGKPAKTDILQQAFLHCNGNVLYCDASTYPLQPLEGLFSDIERGTLYLHAPHRYAESELGTAFRRLASRRSKEGTAVAAPPGTRIAVWHTAVIGLNDRHKELVATLAQDAAPQKGMALDYAFTKAFGERGKLKSAAKTVFDYSDLSEFGQLLETFFKKNEEESIPNQVKALHHIDAAAIQQQKEAYQRQPVFKKWLHLITGKRWSIQQYTSKL